MDLKFALRSLAKSPGFTAVAILVLALGIGANTAIFSVINAVLLRPLPYTDPDRIVTLFSVRIKGGTTSQVSGPDFHDWRSQADAFDGMAYYSGGRTSVVAGSEPEQIGQAMITPDFWRVMGAEPSLGRTPQETGTVAISHAFWMRNFGGDRKALGRPLKMLDRSFTIVGVLPAGFQFPGTTDVWFAANTVFPETKSRTAHNYRVVARLKSGVGIDQAQAQMSAIADRLLKQYPENFDKGVAVIPLHEQMVRTSKPTLYLLLGAVALVLLIACANVANLLLARATGRVREIAIRAAVGASRARIVKLLVTESAVLAAAAGAGGVLIALWTNELLVNIAPATVPRIGESRLDGWVLGFTLLVSLAASLLFGLAPAWQASRADLNHALKQGGNRTAAGGSGRLRAVLVTGEIALSMMLVAAAGLMIRSFVALNNVDPGFRSQGVVAMESAVPASGRESAQRAVRFYEELLRQAATIPGIGQFGAARDLPTQSSSNGLYEIEGRPKLEPSQWRNQQAGFRVISGGYFATLGIPVKDGRDFTAADREGAMMTVIVNEALVKQSFGGESPIGRRIRCGMDSPEFMTVVGVVGDVRQLSLDRPPQPEMYMPFAQHPFFGTAMTIVAKPTGDAGQVTSALRKLARAQNPEVPAKFTTVDEKIAASTASPRFRVMVVGAFAGLALLLAMAGVYGVMAYSVGQRASEIGLRMALGARPMQVLGMVMSQAGKLVAAGLVVGLVGALAASRVMESFLFNVKPTDPATYALVALALTIAGLAAGFVPARRAASVDPMIALREE